MHTQSPPSAETLASQRVWLKTEDIAVRYQTSPGTVRYWRHIGYGPTGVRIGRRTLYDLAEVERWEAEQITKAKA